MQTPWDHRFAQRTQRMGSSAIRELLKLTEEPDIISFGGGMPAPDVFPADEMSEACVRVFARHRRSGAAIWLYGRLSSLARDDRAAYRALWDPGDPG